MRRLYYKVWGKDIYIKINVMDYLKYFEIIYLSNIEYFEDYLKEHKDNLTILTAPNYKNFINSILSLINTKSEFDVYDLMQGDFNYLKDNYKYFSLESTQNSVTLTFITYRNARTKFEKVGVNKLSDIEEKLSLFKV